MLAPLLCSCMKNCVTCFMHNYFLFAFISAPRHNAEGNIGNSVTILILIQYSLVGSVLLLLGYCANYPHCVRVGINLPIVVVILQ